MAEMQLNILSPAKVVAKTKATHVLVPGIEGYLGILPGHTRFVTEMATGELAVDEGSTRQVYFVSGGYVEVIDDVVTVLADVVEKPGDIDVQRAEKAKARALDRLHQRAGVDVMRAQAALTRASTRLTMASGRR
jgi:F-type H+-transporting ATPase subunit epsilon